METSAVGQEPISVRQVPSRFKGAGDAELIAAARSGSDAAFETIIRRHNRLLFRTARAIVQNEADAEEIVQETYLKAFTHLESFARQSRLSTWLVRIAVNESLARLRRNKPTVRTTASTASTEWSMTAETDIVVPGFSAAPSSSPEAAAAQGEVRRLLENAIDSLPQTQRAVFMLRAVEEFSTEDTSICLGIPEETVKTRLHRAKKQLRSNLHRRVASTLSDTFPFAGARCDRIVKAVRLRLSGKQPGG
ncbi:MAG: RNA polymerase sigma factor [Kiloniellaceae bacterium]